MEPPGPHTQARGTGSLALAGAQGTAAARAGTGNGDLLFVVLMLVGHGPRLPRHGRTYS